MLIFSLPRVFSFLPWDFSFCHESFPFCREVFLFAVRVFFFPRVFSFLPWGFSFCREVSLFAVRLILLPWQLWATVGYRLCGNLRKITLQWGLPSNSNSNPGLHLLPIHSYIIKSSFSWRTLKNLGAQIRLPQASSKFPWIFRLYFKLHYKLKINTLRKVPRFNQSTGYGKHRISYRAPNIW